MCTSYVIVLTFVRMSRPAALTWLNLITCVMGPHSTARHAYDFLWGKNRAYSCFLHLSSLLKERMDVFAMRAILPEFENRSAISNILHIKKFHSTVQDAKIHISELRFSKDISIVMLIADFHYAPNDIRHHYLPRKTSITKGLSVPPQSL
jgi:hypothetical protein